MKAPLIIIARQQHSDREVIRPWSVLFTWWYALIAIIVAVFIGIVWLL